MRTPTEAALAETISAKSTALRWRSATARFHIPRTRTSCRRAFTSILRIEFPKAFRFFPDTDTVKASDPWKSGSAKYRKPGPTMTTFPFLGPLESETPSICIRPAKSLNTIGSWNNGHCPTDGVIRERIWLRIP